MADSTDVAVVEKSRVGKMGEKQELRKEILGIAGTIETIFIDLGAKLYEVWKSKYYTSWGFEKFDDYLKHDLSNNSTRRAYYLLSIHEYFVEDLKDPELLQEIKGIGWSKLKELIHVVDRKNKDYVMKMAEECPLGKFIKGIKKYRETLSDARDKVSGEIDLTKKDHKSAVDEAMKEAMKDNNFMKFVFTEDQKKNVEDALDIAGKISKSDVNSNNLSLIALDFIASHAELAKKSFDDEKALNHYLEATEKRLGVRLVAIKNKEIIFGKELVE